MTVSLSHCLCPCLCPCLCLYLCLWKVAGNRTAEALQARGYSYRHVFSLGTHHCDPLAINATLADTLVWLWAEDEAITGEA